MCCLTGDGITGQLKSTTGTGICQIDCDNNSYP
jgi:hypothetical protein